ncbi:MAG: flippase-like domain-containing protein [Coriobacteriales bacterium]|nr:flippase-like domain-containing protein [Coriobacteriales bacterium]
MRFANLRTLAIGIVIIVALSVLWLRGDQLLELGQTMEGGDLIPLVFAVALQFGKYISQSYAYAEAFAVVGESTRARTMLPLVFGSYFVNVIAPSFNTAGVMLVIDSARKRGVPAGRATSAALLMQISVITGFIVIMCVGFTILQLAGRLSVLWFMLGMVVVFFAGVMVTILYMGRRNPDILTGLLRPLERLVNHLSQRFRKGREVRPWVDNVVESFSEAAGNIRSHPWQSTRVFLFSILASTFELACFCCVGVAFGLSEPHALVGGYVIATLFSWIAITPQGVGVVEAMIVFGLAAYKVGATTATAIALTYRGIVFWMPFVIGAVLIHRTKSFSKRELPSDRTKRLASHEPEEEHEGVLEGVLDRSPNHGSEGALNRNPNRDQPPTPNRGEDEFGD